MRAQAHNRAKFPVRLPLVFLNRFWYNKKTGAAQAAFRYKARVLRPQLFQGWNTVLYGSGQVCAAGRREPCQAGNRAALSGCSRAMQVACPFPYAHWASALCFYRTFCQERRSAPCTRCSTGNTGPSSFADVVGQPQVTVTLKNEVMRGRIAHAYLFTGSRGTGKTTCAKILARAVNCLHPKDGDPCGECEICKGLEEGSILDVVEIDAASNNGVDNIRSLHRGGQLHPGHGQIPGVHHRRGPHALHRGLQRPAEDPGGAPGPRDLYSGHHRGPQAAAHHSVPVPAVRLPAHRPRGDRRPAGGGGRRRKTPSWTTTRPCSSPGSPTAPCGTPSPCWTSAWAGTGT